MTGHSSAVGFPRRSATAARACAVPPAACSRYRLFFLATAFFARRLPAFGTHVARPRPRASPAWAVRRGCAFLEAASRTASTSRTVRGACRLAASLACTLAVVFARRAACGRVARELLALRRRADRPHRSSTSRQSSSRICWIRSAGHPGPTGAPERASRARRTGRCRVLPCMVSSGSNIRPRRSAGTPAS